MPKPKVAVLQRRKLLAVLEELHATPWRVMTVDQDYLEALVSCGWLDDSFAVSAKAISLLVEEGRIPTVAE
jgi:hypothetical protein